MKYTVNGDCIGCGLCVATCENVFSIGDEGTAVATAGEVSEADLEAAAEAKEGCPVGAIEEA